MISGGASGRSTLWLNIYLFGVYTNISIYSGESLLVPNVFALLGAVCIAMRPLCHERRMISGIVVMIGFVLISAVFGGSGFGLIGQRMLSFVQLALSLAAAYLAFVFACALSPHRLRRLCRNWLLFLLIGTTLEFVGVLRPFSDWFRSIAYGGWLYEAGGRDTMVYGALRPNLFTQEPSHVAKAFVAFCAAWYVMSRWHWKTVVLFAATGLMIVVLRSPFVVLAAPVAIFGDIMVRLKPRGDKWLIVVLVCGLAAFALTLFAATALFSNRFALIASGSDMSFYMRFYGPYLTAMYVLHDFPLFGVGIGGKEFLAPYLWQTFPMVGRTAFETSYLALSGNGLANAAIFFGLGGSAIFWFLVWQIYRSISLTAAVFGLAMTLLFFNLDGAFEGARLWGYITILMIAFVAARRGYAVRRVAQPTPAPELLELPAKKVA